MTTHRSREEQKAEFVSFLCRHLVCMGVNYIALDGAGNEVGETRFYGASGFVIEFRGKWFFVTAGHVFQDDFEPNLRGKKIAIVSSSFADYFGPDAKVNRPTPFDYEDIPKYFIDDREYGLDLALLHLRPFYRSNLEANGVVPIIEENWRHQDSVKFDAHSLLGFPATNDLPFSQDGEFGAEWVASSRPALVSVKKLDSLPDDIPGSNLPWFVGRLPDESIIKSVKGMSGGPIFGFQFAPKQLYWVVAIQSRQIGRTVLGCPVPVFMGIMEGALHELEGQVP